MKYWVWFSMVKDVTPRVRAAMLSRFGSAERVYFAPAEELREVVRDGWRPFADKDLTAAVELIERCRRDGIGILTPKDRGYPGPLRTIADPPPVIFYRGRLPDLDRAPAVAVVGTRLCSPYGLLAAERIGYEIACCGGTVVTGLAHGIDTAAARGALRAGGHVIGVLGCGVDVVYPKGSGELFAAVLENGTILSEFPPGTPPLGRNFPVRNRILSGLSAGVVVAEAPEKSGALITASLALEQGRDVFAVPGNINTPSCAGSNALLREGATPALSGVEIMEQYMDMYPEGIRIPGRLRYLDERSRRELLDSETGRGNVKRPSGAKRAAGERSVRAKKAGTDGDATKKVIDNGEKPVYIDIIVDPGTLSLDERAVLSAIHGRTHVDDITAVSRLPSQAVLSALTMLEIQGIVSQEPGKFFTPHYKFKESKDQGT